MDIRRLFKCELLKANRNIKKCEVRPELIVDGERILLFRHNPSVLTNQNVLIIAPPKEGKTTLVKSMLLSMYKIKPTVLLFAPTNTLGTDFIPNFMWISSKRPNLGKFIADIKRYQTEMRTYYDLGSQLEVLSDIANKLNLSNGDAGVMIRRLNDRSADKKASEYIDKLMSILRFYIRSVDDAMLQARLSQKEYMVTRNMMREPHMVMIFDDMASEMRSLGEHLTLCTNYRHLSITLFTLIHHGNMVYNSVRTCASYIIVRNNCDLIWLIDTCRGSTNAETETFIRESGEKMRQIPTDTRFFSVLSNNHKHMRMQLFFTAVQYSLEGMFYQCNNGTIQTKLGSEEITGYNLCKYIRHAINNGMIR